MHCPGKKSEILLTRKEIIKMRRITLAIIAAALAVFFLTNSALAEDYQWSGNYYISYVYPQSGGYVFALNTTDNLTPNASCTNRFFISTSIANYDSLAATVMLAYALEKQVDIYYDHEYTGCSAPVTKLKGK
jgi:hypothetical protein